MAVMEQKKLSQQIAALGKSSAEFRSKVQDALISAIYYGLKDHNAQPLNSLLDAVGNGVNIRAITHYATTFGPFYVKNERLAVSKAAAKETGVVSPETFEPLEAEMRKVEWWSFNKEGNKAQNVWDSVKRIDSFLGTLSKHDPALAEHLRKETAAFNGKRAQAAIAV